MAAVVSRAAAHAAGAAADTSALKAVDAPLVARTEEGASVEGTLTAAVILRAAEISAPKAVGALTVIPMAEVTQAAEE